MVTILIHITDLSEELNIIYRTVSNWTTVDTVARCTRNRLPGEGQVNQRTARKLNIQCLSRKRLAARIAWICIRENSGYFVEPQSTFNASSISPVVVRQSFPNGIDVVVAGPPCQPYSSAGKGKGFRDPRSKAMLAVARLLVYLDATQAAGVGYIVENVPGTRNHPKVRDTLGEGVLLDAPPCGSHAQRKAVFWQNWVPNSRLSQAYRNLGPGPRTSVEDLLRTHGITDWTPQLPVVGYNMSPWDQYNTSHRPLVALPKFVCYPGSHAFRFKGGKPGLGLMHHDGVLQEPPADIREIAMGFLPGATAAPGLSEKQRRHLLGQCIDVNLLSWLVITAGPPLPEDHAPVRNPALDRQGVGLSACDLVAQAARARLPYRPCEYDRDLTEEVSLPAWPVQTGTGAQEGDGQAVWAAPPPLLPFVAGHDPRAFTYTDGSKVEGSSRLGAAVVPPVGPGIPIDATGAQETNTVVRAELAAIYVALDHSRGERVVRLLTDSMTAIDKLRAQVLRPYTQRTDHHLPLLRAIVSLIALRDAQEGFVTAIYKVPAHRGVVGNEAADALARRVAKVQPGGELPQGTVRCDLGAEPHRPPFWYFRPSEGPPEAPEDAGDPSQPAEEASAQLDWAVRGHAELRRLLRPQLEGHSAPFSLYRALIARAQAQGAVLPRAQLQRLLRGPGVRDGCRLLKFLWGWLYTAKLAHRFKRADSDRCLLCGRQDSCTHVGGGCLALSGLYIDRHNAAVRAIESAVSRGSNGAARLWRAPELISCDAGTKVLPPVRGEATPQEGADWVPADQDLQEVVRESVLQDWPGQPDPVRADVSIDVPAYAERLAERRSAAASYEPPPCPRRIPEWVLPADECDRLRAEGHGVVPDLVYAAGKVLVLVEVGFCADLRVEAKFQEKTEKYTALVQCLRSTAQWDEVRLVSVPIGAAGTLLQTSIDQLTPLLGSGARGAKLARGLASSLADLAVAHLLRILRTRSAMLASTSASGNTPPPGPKNSSARGPSATGPRAAPRQRNGHLQSGLGRVGIG